MTVPPKRWKRGGAIRSINVERHEREWTRAYESLERVLWGKRRRCIVCRALPSENAHIENDGKGRKADADKIVSLCHEHHDELDNGDGREAFEQEYAVDLAAAAATHQAEWVAFCGEAAP